MQFGNVADGLGCAAAVVIGVDLLLGSAQCQTSVPSATSRPSSVTPELESMIAATEVEDDEAAGEAWMRLLRSENFLTGVPRLLKSRQVFIVSWTCDELIRLGSSAR